MARKIYIGKTYKTKFDTEFTVDKVVKGNSANSRDRSTNQCRRAIDKEGNIIKITNLIEVVEQYSLQHPCKSKLERPARVTFYILLFILIYFHLDISIYQTLLYLCREGNELIKFRIMEGNQIAVLILLVSLSIVIGLIWIKSDKITE